jgi:hypothetical protein
MSSSKIIYLNKNDFLNGSLNGGFSSYLNPGGAVQTAALMSSPPAPLNPHHHHHHHQLSGSHQHLGSPLTNGKLAAAVAAAAHQSSSSPFSSSSPSLGKNNSLVYGSPTQEFEKGK